MTYLPVYSRSLTLKLHYPAYSKDRWTQVSCQKTGGELISAGISPVFKKGDRTKASNYRPVFLTSICSKVLDHILCSNISDHLDQYNVLCEEQHGFCSKHSCESQLVQTIHDLALALDNRKQTEVVIMDFLKAFDKVANNRLLLKLSHYGIRGNTYNWISSFLKDRHQRVVVDGSHSEWVHCPSRNSPRATSLSPVHKRLAK